MLKQRFFLAAFVISLGINVFGMILHWHWLAVPMLVLGWYMADLTSGVVHMIMDYRPCPPGKRLNDIYFYKGSRESAEYLAMFQQRMAAINAVERVVYDFKNHHPRPDALGRRPLWRLIGSTVMVAALPVSLLLNALMLTPFAVPGWLSAYVVTYLLGGAFAQYFHGSLHRQDNPAFITVLRKLHLLMTPAAHQLHHDTLQRDFSTNCGWSNPVVNRLFRLLRQRGYLDDAGLEPSS
jgi:hypothetical protein